MAEQLQFYGWQRSGVFGLASGALEQGRLRAALTLTLRDRDNAADRVDESVEFLVLGPRDALGLQPGAVVTMMPPPESLNAETTKLVYVELAAPDLPWRYTPEVTSDLSLRPWIVLIVGTPDEIELQPRSMLTFSAMVAAKHPLKESARWAHVQDDGHRLITRLLSPRELEANKPYIAAIVPAFNEQGADAWSEDAGATLPCYHFWRFRTGPEGDFQSLAKRLNAAFPPDPTLGQAPLSYRRVEPPVVLQVRGALAPIGGADTMLQQDVADDVAQLTTPLSDPRGRPIVTLPRYGAPWLADPLATTWGAAANVDPRHRGAAGLGQWAGIALQEQLMDAAAQQVGALDIAAQRIRHLTFGLAAVRSLWERRLPGDPAQRLLLYGPSLRRIVTPTGPALDQVAGKDRPLPPRLFSSAASRVLRVGPARTALAGREVLLPSKILDAANACAPPPERTSDGLPHADRASQAFGLAALDDLLRQGDFDPRRLIERFLVAAEDPEWQDLLADLRDRVRAADLERLSLLPLLEILQAVESRDKERVAALVRSFESLQDLGKELVDEPPDRPCRPVKLSELEAMLTSAVDPTAAEPLVQRRVLNSIDGLGDQPLAPTEVCVGLDFPIWTFLRDQAPDFLLPGVNTIAEDTVVAVESNPAFVDAFLLGLNAQVLSELRWRNVPIAAGCTPTRMFWGQVDIAAGTHKADIRGVSLWANVSSLGSADHQPPPPAGTDLVIVFRSDLFRRYPQTIVYLVPAPMVQGEPNWQIDPPFSGSDRLLPTFQGSVGEDITFFRFDVAPLAAQTRWVVLEEPPPGYSFDNVPVDAADGANFAAATFHNPVRVLIRGDRLIGGE
jgi:hypothetical protein